MARILVVDDARFARRMVLKALKGAGHEVLEAGDGREALAKLPVVAPDLVILDLLMPELDGIGVLEALRAEGSQIPVIVVTADIQDSVRRQVLELGARDLLKKPPDKKALVARIAELLEGGA